jgi:hypothetical protein
MGSDHHLVEKDDEVEAQEGTRAAGSSQEVMSNGREKR